MSSKMQYFKTDKNGTMYYADYTCPRCGGAGGSDKWAFTGWTCYECGGKGERLDHPQIIKKYTPEYQAKLDAQRAKRAEKKRLERVAKYNTELPEMIQKKGFNEAGEIYLVIGNTYPIKDELREAGAKWSGNLQGWIFTQPTEYTTIVLKAEECLNFNPEAGTMWWKDCTELKDVVDSKIPQEEEAVSQFIGSVGDKLDMIVTPVIALNYERASFRGFGTDLCTIYKFKDEAGNIIIWNTTGYIKDFDKLEKAHIKGTIKEHSIYKGEAQTIIQRCKVERAE